jgi:hypothetical protein
MPRKPNKKPATTITMGASKQVRTAKAEPYKSLRKRQGDPEASVVAPGSKRLVQVPTSLTTVEAIAEAESVVRVMARMPKPMHKELKQLALNRDTHLQALLIEATEDLLAKYRE